MIPASFSSLRRSAFSLLVAVAGLLSAPAAQDLAWAWVRPTGQPTTFTPMTMYSHSSSGAPISVTRDSGAANRFHVEMLQMAPVTGVPMAFAYGGNHTAIVRSWTASGMTVRITVELWWPDGTPADDQPFVINFRRGGRAYQNDAYVYAASPSNPSYTPVAVHSYNADRGAPTVRRVAVGVYHVTLPGLAPLGPEAGNVQAVAVGTALRRVEVSDWSANGPDIRVVVRVRNFAGSFADGKFIVAYGETAAFTAGHLGSGAHLISIPTSSAYTPPPPYVDSNGTYGPQGMERVVRLGTGRYRVDLPNLAPSSSATVQVTSNDPLGFYPTIKSWYTASPTGTHVLVNTYRPDGTPDDARFTLRFMTNRPALGGTAASNTNINGGCYGMTLDPRTAPIISTRWQLDLRNLPANYVVPFVQLGLSDPNAPISGTAGCVQHTDGLVTNALTLFANPAVSLTIPDDPSFIGLELFAQGAALVPSINPLWLAVSNGVRGFVGDR